MHTRYLSVLDNVPDMAMVIDPKSLVIIDVNQAFLKKEGLSRKDIIGKKCYEITHKRVFPCQACPLKTTLKTRKTAKAEHIHYDKNNNPYYVEIVTALMQGPSGKNDLIIHISHKSPFSKSFNNLVKEKGEKYLKELKSLVIRDPLTNVYNYRYLMEKLPMEIYQAKRYDMPFSLAILDVDYFKSINDTYGHRVGDRILVGLGEFLKKILRKSDILTRYGGEEFVVLMPHTDKLEALQAATRFLNEISRHPFKTEGLVIRLKVSLGIAFFDAETSDQRSLLDAADEALQRAKNSGGSIAVIYSSLYKDKKCVSAKTSPYEEVSVLKRKIQKLTERVDRVVLESIYAFSRSMEARDYYTAEHAEQMVAIALKIGKEIGLSQGMLNNLERAATLHDLGKIGISDAILRKKSKLTVEEFRMIKMHPKIGAEIIRAIHFLKDVVPVVLHHHERWDGLGYPSGLKAREIPLCARVVAIADAYQALISDRPYRKGYSKEQALDILKKESGQHFDKGLVDILVRLETS